MRLIGMLDSPYVRRVAISLDLLGVEFTHESISVFRDFERFKSINSIVKAPSLVCDDGEVLMDSSLILQFIEATLPTKTSLWPNDAQEMQHDMRAVSLALVGCEKSAQLLYERNMRPAAYQFEPWLNRVNDQIVAAFAALEREVHKRAAAFSNERSQATITAAIAWQFVQSMLPTIVPASSHPYLTQLSARLEKTAVFSKYPPSGPGIPSPQ